MKHQLNLRGNHSFDELILNGSQEEDSKERESEKEDDTLWH